MIPEPVPYVPAAQEVQVDTAIPAPVLYVPGAQREQVETAIPVPYVPVAHSAHTETPATEL